MASDVPWVPEGTSDAMWVVNVTCVVKTYQECRFDVKQGEEFKVSKKIGEKGHAFCNNKAVVCRCLCRG